MRNPLGICLTVVTWHDLSGIPSGCKTMESHFFRKRKQLIFKDFRQKMTFQALKSHDGPRAARSQARANDQLRYAVARAMPRAAPASSIDKPPKTCKRVSSAASAS